MASKIQGITVEIGGDTSGLKKSLGDVNSEIRSTQNELKQVDKLLKLDPTNTELLTQKQELLAKEISTTSDKLNALKEAKKKADDEGLKGSESGQKAYRELQREIISTENQLKNFKEQQESVTQSFDLLGTKAEAVNKVMAGLGAGVLAVGASLVKSGIDAASYADDINTLAAQTGLTTNQIQKFQYASDIIDVSLDTLTGSMAKLIKNMSTASKGTGDAATAFETLGISIVDSNGELRNNQEVFNETIKALADMENETQRDALAMNIFGKSAQDLNPLIKGGADTLEELGQKAEEMGLIMSQDALDSANELNDGIDELKAQWSAATKSLGADLSQYLLPVIESAQDLIKWILENKDAIVVALAAIASGIAAFNFVVMIQKMVKAITAWKAANEGLTIAQAALNLIMNANPIAIIITLVVSLVAAIITLWNTNEDFKNAIINIFGKIKEVITSFVNIVIDFFTVTIPEKLNEFLTFLQNVMTFVISYVTDPIETVREILKTLLPKIKEWALSMLDKVKEGFNKISDVGRYIVEGLWNGILNAKDWLLNKIKTFASSITEGIKEFFGIESPSKVMEDKVGKYIAQGIGVGFEKEIPSLINDMTKDLSEVTSALAAELNVTTPTVNKKVTSQNYYTTKTYQNTTEIIRQPSNVILQVDKTKLGEVVVPAYKKQMKILGATIS